MVQATLTIDLDAVVANWRALARQAGVETGATVKADAYGLGLAPVARALARAGCRRFFVAQVEEGVRLRAHLGPGPDIFVFSGHMPGEAAHLAGAGLIPVLNSPEQLARHLAALPNHPLALMLDTGMNRLGLAPAEWAAEKARALAARPVLILSHLACADEAEHPMNARQLSLFGSLTDGLGLPRSLAATGGIMLGRAYTFDLVRPGIGLYGGAPFTNGQAVVRLDLPVIQCRTLSPGDTVGYGASFVAPRQMRAAVVAAGYADGLFRSLSGRGLLWANKTACPILGRVSMDLIVADISALSEDPESLCVLGPEQGIDALANHAGTIGYEILTALGHRYQRRYQGAYVRSASALEA